MGSLVHVCFDVLLRPLEELAELLVPLTICCRNAPGRRLLLVHGPTGSTGRASARGRIVLTRAIGCAEPVAGCTSGWPASCLTSLVHEDRLTGRVLDGKYILGPRIGQGAIGRIYRATQISLEREVAIKILNPGYTHHPEAIARFRLEARAASCINHPGIVTVLDWGKESDGLLYLVIEYLKGRDLFEVARNEAPLPAARIARLMQQVALALGHAHGLGIVHRDLKPENLRVLEDPTAPPFLRELVKIYDFGVAQVTQGLMRVLTQEGAMVGTPSYMSPEQAASAEAVAQSDLYSCGVIMFLLATGTLPFVAESPLDVAAMHIHKAPSPPSLLNPGIDRRLQDVILACLAKKPAQRPASGAELARLLDPIARGLGSAPAPPRWDRAGLRLTAAGLIGALSVASVFGFAQCSRDGRAAAVGSTHSEDMCAGGAVLAQAGYAEPPRRGETESQAPHDEHASERSRGLERRGSK
jgi:tRNA A-37 threonylcarbamoyl transferase component Bud32